MRIDAWAYANRWRHLACGAKATMALGGMTASLAASRPLAALGVFVVMAALTRFGAGIPWRAYGRLLLVPAGFALVAVAGVAVSLGCGDISLGRLLGVGPQVFLTEAGLDQTSLTLARCLGSVSALYFLVLTTPMTEILGGLRRLHVPELLLELMVLTYAQIFVLLETARQMRIAQASRLGYGDMASGLRCFGVLGGTLYLRAQQRSHQLYRALLGRGYDRQLRWIAPEKSPSPLNLVLTVGGVVLPLVLLYPF